MRTSIAVAVLGCVLAVGAAAQDDVGQAAAEQAEELLREVEARLYSPRGAGLETARCEVRSPLSSMLGRKVKLLLYWQAGDGDTTVDRGRLKVEGELPKMVKPSFVQQMEARVVGLVGGVFASPLAPLRGLRAHAEVTVAKKGKRRTITFRRKADAPASVTISEAVVVVDAKRHELESIATTTGEHTLHLEPTFQSRDDRLLLVGYRSRLDTGKRKGKTTRVDVRWRKVPHDGLRLRLPQELKSSQPRVSITFRDYVLDQPIPDGVFPAPREAK